MLINPLLCNNRININVKWICFSVCMYVYLYQVLMNYSERWYVA